MRAIPRCAVAACLLVGVAGLVAPARAEVTALALGGFDLQQHLVVRGTPTQVYDMITGDLLPWWDHHFTEHPHALYIEPWPGGGFYEIFDAQGNGVRHATVTWAERGKRLRFEGPLGLAGRALDLVCTYDLAAQGPDSTAISFAASMAGKCDAELAAGVDGVWRHFLVERLKPYAGTEAALHRKPWPRGR